MALHTVLIVFFFFLFLSNSISVYGVDYRKQFLYMSGFPNDLGRFCGLKINKEIKI